MNTLNFIVSSSYKIAKNLRPERPFFCLVPRVWDDYGNSTLHQLYFYPQGREDETLIGEVKIMKSGEKNSSLISPFSALEPNQISLGQTLSYYENLRERCGGLGSEVLDALRDVALHQAFADEYEDEHVYKNSLIRTNEARTAFLHGKQTFRGKPISSDFSFSYTHQKHYEDEPLTANFNFTKSKILPWRICAIIGKNGVGKTQLLSKLAIDLVQETEFTGSKNRDEKLFSPNMPIFSRVIALSFSAFDRFVRPKENAYVSYFYCGMMDSNRRVSLSAVKERYRAFLEKIERNGRTVEFATYLSEVLHGEHSLPRPLHPDTAAEIVSNFNLDRLSSGQGLAAYSIAALMALIVPNSLILFDEPELHLHPNAVATLMKILHEIVEEHRAFAILATHSPLVIREIPSKNVQVFERYGEVVSAEELQGECLGEDISELTRQIFETISISSPYKAILKEIARKYEFEDISSLFEKGLSMNAMAYLSAQYRKGNIDEK